MMSSLISRFSRCDYQLIFLSADKLALYYSHKGELKKSYLFNKDEAGLALFEQCIQAMAETPTYILADVVEEFSIERIPHISGKDRKAMITRRKDQLFRRATYFYHEIQGRDSEGRRDDIIRFTAISNDDHIRPVMQCLHKYRVPLQSMVPLSKQLESLLPKLRASAERVLLVSLQSISGLRQTFFHKNKLQFSRLINLSYYGSQSYAPKIMAEVNNAFHYLTGIGLMSGDQALDVYFLADEKLLADLEQQPIPEGLSFNCHFVNKKDLLARNLAHIQQSHPFSDHLFVQHFLEKPSPNIYATRDELFYSNLRSTRYVLYMFSIVIILGAIIYTVLSVIEVASLKRESIALAKGIEFYTQRYNEEKALLTETPVEPEQLKSTVEMITQLQRHKSTPIPMMSFIGTALVEFPELRVRSIKWNTHFPQELEGEDLTAFATADVKYYQTAILAGTIDSFDGGYRAAINRINHFIAMLEHKNALVKVQILNLPVDTSSENAMRGDMQDTQQKAEFGLKIRQGIIDNAER